MLNRIFSRKSKTKARKGNGQGSLLDLLETEADNVVEFPLAPEQPGPGDGSLLSELEEQDRIARELHNLERADAAAAQRLARISGIADRSSAARSIPSPVSGPPIDRPEPATDTSSHPNHQEQLDLLSRELEEVATIMREHNPNSGERESIADGGGPLASAPHQPTRKSTTSGRRANTSFSFDNVVAAVFGRWWFVAVCGFLGASIAAIYALSVPNKYLSIAEILIEPRGIKVIENTVLPTELNSQATIAYAESQVRILASSSVLDLVVTDLELADDREFNSTAQTGGLLGHIVRGVLGKPENPMENFAAAKEYLHENLFVSRINQTFTIQIGVTTRDPTKSARVANAIARAYINAETTAKSSAARNATEDLTGRLDELRTLVRQSEEQVEAYKAENGLVDAEGKLVSEVQLTRLSNQLALVQSQATDARSRAEQAAQADLSDVISGALPTALASPTVSELRVAYSRAKSRLDRISTTLGERHPERIAALAELRSARQAIASELSRIVESAQEDYRSARKRLADVQGQVNTLKANAVEDSAAKVKLRELEREVEANRRVYESFLLRSRETGEQEKIRTESARIITEATPPAEKEGPNRKFITLAGGVVGGLVGVFFVLLPLAFQIIREFASGEKTQGSHPEQPNYDDGLYTSVPSTGTQLNVSPGMAPPLAGTVGNDAPGRSYAGAGKGANSLQVTKDDLDALRNELLTRQATQAQGSAHQGHVQPSPPIQMPLFAPPQAYAPPIYAHYPPPVLQPQVIYPQPVPVAYPGWPQQPSPKDETSK